MTLTATGRSPRERTPILTYIVYIVYGIAASYHDQCSAVLKVAKACVIILIVAKMPA